jgi:hypothetical protein
LLESFSLFVVSRIQGLLSSRQRRYQLMFVIVASVGKWLNIRLRVSRVAGRY